MASATPDLRLSCRPQSITAIWPVPNCTAWWQRHMGVSNLPRVVAWCCAGQESNPSQNNTEYTCLQPQAYYCYCLVTDPQESIFLVKIIRMVRMIVVDESKPFVVSPPYNDLKLRTITSDIVSHLINDQHHIWWRYRSYMWHWCYMRHWCWFPTHNRTDDDDDYMVPVVRAILRRRPSWGAEMTVSMLC